MGTVYTNNVCAVQKIPIVGWVVLSEHGWVPLGDLNKDELEIVRRAVNWGPIFPDELKQELYGSKAS